MILKLEDLIIGTVVGRRYCYVNTDFVKYVEISRKRIAFLYNGWHVKRVVASSYNLRQVRKWVGDTDL